MACRCIVEKQVEQSSALLFILLTQKSFTCGLSKTVLMLTSRNQRSAILQSLRNKLIYYKTFAFLKQSYGLFSAIIRKCKFTKFHKNSKSFWLIQIFIVGHFTKGIQNAPYTSYPDQLARFELVSIFSILKNFDEFNTGVGPVRKLFATTPRTISQKFTVIPITGES